MLHKLQQPEIVRKRDWNEELHHRWIEYEKKKSICGEKRNSYSKTDPDTTFMHMNNSQIKPGYNVQFAVNSGFVTGIGVFSDWTDFGALILFLHSMQNRHGRKYEKIIADSGYENLVNYRRLKANGETAFIKPNNYEFSQIQVQQRFTEIAFHPPTSLPEILIL